jgi:uncharacterized membrane protein YdjX (TVP38/TMEM64 family)
MCNIRFLFMPALILAAGLIGWPIIVNHAADIQRWMLALASYADSHPFVSIGFYMTALMAILYIGLPLSTLVMLFAGILWSFWAAVTIVSLSRLAVCVSCFLIARRLSQDAEYYAPSNRVMDMVSKWFHGHEPLCLFVLRILPLPDNLVSFSMGAAGLGGRSYVALSILGILPISLLMVWLGSQVGSVHALVNLIF